MLVNADFSRRAIVTSNQYRWIASPERGVERVMLDRLGGEQARATSIVRYAPGSSFPAHAHPGGEEILVLSGSFCEDDQCYPAGWYLRNPPGSSHRPSSTTGATIFVKLWQMRPEERDRIRIDTRAPEAWHRIGGHDVCPLFNNGAEQVCLQRIAAGESLFAGRGGGAEFLVLNGSLTVHKTHLQTGSWMRLPVGEHQHMTTGPQGATIYLKTGHLADFSGKS